MATKKHPLFSPAPQRPPTCSPALSAVRTSSLASGSLRSYPVTSSPFSSSPTFSFSQPPPSPHPSLSQPPSSPHLSFSQPPPSPHPSFTQPSSSPPFSFAQAASSKSPDFFDDFTYSEDMDDDFGRIDADAAAILGNGLLNDNHCANPNHDHGKRWVVFRGKNPGIYNY
jgi:hypothetical protein